MPATVIETPLGIEATFSDGSGCRRLVSSRIHKKAVTRNPALARELLLGLADMVHPHGEVDSEGSVASYLGSIRMFTNTLADQGFTGTCADLTRGKLAALWMAGTGGFRPAGHEQAARAMLRSVDDLHRLLRPDVRELVDGRTYGEKRQSNTLAPYSEAEWVRLTEACRAAVKQSYAAHRRAVEQAARGADPYEHGWSADNVRWAYAQWGPVDAKPVGRWSPGHPSGLFKSAFPYRHAAETEDLFVSPTTVVAYRLLLGVYTGIVPDGLDDLGLDDIDWAGDTSVLLSYVKGRTAGESRTLTKRAGRLLERWLEHSALTRRFAPAEERRELWVRFQPYSDSRWGAGTVDKQTVRRWVNQSGLLGDDGKPFRMHLHRIRTTHDSMRDRRAWAGSGRATMDPNRSPGVEGDHYLGPGTERQRELVEEIIAQSQGDMLRRAERPVVLPQQDVAALVRDYPQRVAALGLDDAALRALVGGARDVFSAACGDQPSGLHGPKGKPCPARPWVCLLCPLALFTPRHLPNLMRLRAYFARQWDQMTAAEFMGVFGLYDQRLAEILAPDTYFTSQALLAAAEQVAGTDDELPLRAEERTR